MNDIELIIGDKKISGLCESIDFVQESKYVNINVHEYHDKGLIYKWLTYLSGNVVKWGDKDVPPERALEIPFKSKENVIAFIKEIKKHKDIIVTVAGGILPEEYSE